jgi:tetratricopeptide (TPR) repeat protein
MYIDSEGMMRRVADGERIIGASSVILAFLGLFLFLAPFERGLFVGHEVDFEESLFIALSCTFIALIFISIYFYRNWQMVSHRDILSILIWLIPLSYWISSIDAVTNHWSETEVYIKAAWVVFFIIGAYFTRSPKGLQIVQLMLIGSGYIVMIHGLLNWLENAHYSDAIIAGRLSGVFQYPNAYAAYLIALLLCSLILIHATTNKLHRILHTFLLIPTFLSLLLTLSRGALIIFFLVMLFYMVIIPWYRQITSIVVMGIAGISAMFLYGRLMNIRDKLTMNFSMEASLNGWLLVFGISAIASVVIYIVVQMLAKFLSNKFEYEREWGWKNLAFPAVILLVLFGFFFLLTADSALLQLLPESLRARFEGINAQSTSVYLRNVLFEDGLKLASDFPLFGAGGGAWSVLNAFYKSYPYTSTRVHNFYIEHLLESGWFGFSILIIFLMYIAVLFVINLFKSVRRSDYEHSRLVFPVFSIVILGHSFLDFDMSYFYLSAIVFLSLGATVAVADEPILNIRTMLGKNTLLLIKKGYIAVLIFIAFTLLIHSFTALRADASYKSAWNILMTDGNYDEFQAHMDRALSRKSSHPDYNNFQAQVLFNLYQQTLDEGVLQRLERSLDSMEHSVPYSKRKIELEYELAMELQEYDRALKVVSNAIHHYPWDISLYERAVALYILLGNMSDMNSQYNYLYLEEANSLIDQIIWRESIIDQLPEMEREMSRGVYGMSENLRENKQLLDKIYKHKAVNENELEKPVQ